MQKIVNIPVGFIYAHPRNPRKSLGDLTELAKMGYEESGEETAWRDGSHELYGED